MARLRLGVSAAAWGACGFEVVDRSTAIGSVALDLTGGGESALEQWTFLAPGSAERSGATGNSSQADRSSPGSEVTSIDGIPTVVTGTPELRLDHPHPNDSISIDHVVFFTDDIRRTTTAIEGVGINLRRVREPDEPGPPVRQAFFRAGEVILEVVENVRMEGLGTQFWGITMCVGDIDRTAALLGDRLGRVHDAVQPGRRIATVRREAGLGIPVAFISES